MPTFENESEKYDYYHSICPNCFEETFDDVGDPITFDVPMKNPNKYKCVSCGWIGFQHQMLPKNLEGVKKI